MKSKSNPFRSPALSGAAVVFACFTLLNHSAKAVDQLWIGSATDHNVTTPSNWAGGAPVVDSWAPFVFGSDVVDGTMNLTRWVAVSSITLNSGLTHDITIDNGPIIMGGSLVDLSSAGANLTLNAQLQQAWGDMTFNVAASRTLMANGGVAEAHWFTYSGLPGATDYLQTGLTKNGDGKAVLGGASTYTLGTTINAGTLELGGTGTLGGGSYAGTITNNGAFVHSSSADQTLAAISGSGSITQSGASTLILTSWGVGNSGTITVNSGTIQMPDGNWNQESHNIVVNGGTFSTSDGNSRALSWTLNGGTVSSRGDASPTFWGNVMLYDSQAVTVGGAAVSTISSHVMLGADSEFAVSAGSTLNVTGALSNSVWATGGNGSFIKTGDGTLALSGANNYTGTTTVNGGILEYGGAGAIGSTSQITANPGGQVYFDAGTTGATVNQPIQLNGDGGAAGGALKTYVEGGQITFTGPITLLGSSLIQGFGGHTTQNFTNAIHGTGVLTFAAIGGAPNHKDFMVLSGTSDFAGALAIVPWECSAQVTLSGGDNRLPITAVVSVSGTAGSPPTALDLNGNNQELAGLSDAYAWGSDVSSQTHSVVNTSGTAVTLTLNTTADQSFSGTIGGSDINGTAGNNLALVKSGGGKQTLNGPNTYSGNTTVNGGTLSLGQVNSDNESSTVSIAASAGAKLDLAFAGTDTVGQLYINGVQQPAGNYTTSHASGAFTGGGTLHVTSGPSGYAGWQSANHTSGTINQDHDNDGVANGIEYFLGGNTNTTGFTALPPVDKALDGTLSVTWPKGTGYSGIYNTDYAVETSTTLNGVWQVETLGGGHVTDTPGYVKYTFPTPLGSTKFARLVVTGP